MTGRELIQKFIDNKWFDGTLEEGLAHLDNWIECPQYSYLQHPDKEITEYDASDPDEIVRFQEYLDSLKPTWGGYRPGAGRKPVEEKRKPYCFRLTEEEHKKAKEYITKLKRG